MPYQTRRASLLLMIALCWALILPLPAHAATDFQPTTPNGEIDPRLHGTWASRGYGWIVQIQETGPLRFFDYTKAGCMADEAPREALAVFLPLFTIQGDSFAATHERENSTVYTFDRIEQLPQTCTETPAKTPRGVLNYFAQTMADHYAFFEVHQIDWPARRAKAEAAIRPDMSEKELFAVLGDMLTDIKDGHLRLTAEIGGTEERVSPGRSQLGFALSDAFARQKRFKNEDKFHRNWYRTQRKQVEKLLRRSYNLAAGKQLAWGRIGQVGYIGIFGMGDFAGDEGQGMAAELRAVHGAMTQALTDLADTEALIVDITLNGGGDDAVSLAIASHFTDRKALAFSKYAYRAQDATPQPFYVIPARRSHYLKPVTLLTSNYSASAAEIFTMAMRALPNVTQRGEATRGALSDVLAKELPNGWMLTLSNEIYRDSEEILWEGRGIPPAEKVTVFDPKTIETSRLDTIRETAKAMEARLR